MVRLLVLLLLQEFTDGDFTGDIELDGKIHIGDYIDLMHRHLILHTAKVVYGMTIFTRHLTPQR